MRADQLVSVSEANRNKKRLKTKKTSQIFLNCATVSMRSTWPRNIARQQYLSRPASSRAFFRSSPFATFSWNFSQRWPIGFPQLQHLMGIIMGSPVRFLHFRPRLAVPVWLPRFLPPDVGDEHVTVVLEEQVAELAALVDGDQGLGDGQSCGIRLRGHAAADHLDIDVHLLGGVSGEHQRLADLRPVERGRVVAEEDAVDPDDARARVRRGLRYRTFSLAGFMDCFHGSPTCASW